MAGGSGGGPQRTARRAATGRRGVTGGRGRKTAATSSSQIRDRRRAGSGPRRAAGEGADGEGRDGRRQGPARRRRISPPAGRIDEAGMEWTDAPDEGKKMDAAAALLRLNLQKRNGFGDGGCRPQEQDEAPRGSAAAMRRVVAGSQPRALLPCHEWKRGRRSELVSCIERGPLGIYREYMRHTPNPRIEEKTILPLTIIL